MPKSKSAIRSQTDGVPWQSLSEYQDSPAVKLKENFFNGCVAAHELKQVRVGHGHQSETPLAPLVTLWCRFIGHRPALPRLAWETSRNLANRRHRNKKGILLEAVSAFQL